MKNFGAASILLLGTVFILGNEGRTYERIADLYDHGQIGELFVLADKGTTLASGPKFHYKVHHYDSTLAGVPVRLSVRYVLKPRFHYAVFYFPEKLQAYALAGSGSFSAYVIGKKSESKWAIFTRDVGRPAFWLLAGFEVLWIVVAIRFLCRANASAR